MGQHVDFNLGDKVFVIKFIQEPASHNSIPSFNRALIESKTITAVLITGNGTYYNYSAMYPSSSFREVDTFHTIEAAKAAMSARLRQVHDQALQYVADYVPFDV